MRLYFFILFFALLGVVVGSPKASAQTVFPMGCQFDSTAHTALPRSAPLLTRSFKVPRKASLRPFCPTPRNQAPYNTCVGWATAYSAFSVIAAINPRGGLQNADDIKVNAFSPSYVYNQIRETEDCMAPAYVHQALDSLTRQGCARMDDFPFDCEAAIDPAARKQAQSYSGLVEGYKTLVPYPDLGITQNGLIKKSISEGNPVIVVMKCYDSFMKLGPDGLWNGTEDRYYGYHALTVIGYDEDVNGGSFEVMNSWGTAWGNGGFAWIRFGDFERVCAGAYEMIKMLPSQKTDPANPAAPSAFNLALAGKMRLVREGGEDIQAGYTKQGHLYRTRQGYRSGTRFRILVESNEPAFVYVIGTDATGKVFKLFPYKEGISAALNYKDAAIALPSETAFIKMDKTAGTDYLCVLYSKRPLKIAEVIKSIEADKAATFSERVQNGLGQRFLGISQVQFDQSGMGFTAKGKQESVVMMLLEMEHLP